ncbi:MAG TPA: helix-turn-helix domain-containing protein [Ramlibacter sp.]|jgi:DNA-binding IclR family transcriptional regulator|nr:helix-turn-helix domain-containing protein [Ramlibacter sp.]
MTVQNRSLERGLSVLDCFRPGVGSLTHREVVERTQLPKPTVTRLLLTLQQCGYLEYDDTAREWRLGLPVLSLARALTGASPLRDAMAPVIEQVARETHTIIGFGAAHGTDIVYLEAHNGDPARPERRVGAGMRAPIATTSVGHAWFAAAGDEERNAVLARLKAASNWKPSLQRELEAARAEVARYGHCLVLRSEGSQAAIGIPLPVRGSPLHALGVGYATRGQASPDRVPRHIQEAVQTLRSAVQRYNNA